MKQFGLAIFGIPLLLLLGLLLLKSCDPAMGEVQAAVVPPEVRKDCVSRVETREVRGQSMAGVFEPGEQITIQHNYYDCHQVQRGDVVVFEYSGNLGEGLYWIKQAYGLPGDTLGLTPMEKGKSTILINNKPVLNVAGEPYQVDKVGASYVRLTLQRLQGNKIPRGRYWMLGTAKVGGWDSRRVGLIPHSYLMGSAVKN